MECGEPEKHNIVELGRATRFGAGRNCPRAAQRKASPPWAIKRAVQRIMRETFDDPDNITLDRLLHVFCPYGRYVTGVQLFAIRAFLMALGGDQGAMKRLTYLSDGPPEIVTE